MAIWDLLSELQKHLNSSGVGGKEKKSGQILPSLILVYVGNNFIRTHINENWIWSTKVRGIKFVPSWIQTGLGSFSWARSMEPEAAAVGPALGWMVQFHVQAVAQVGVTSAAQVRGWVTLQVRDRATPCCWWSCPSGSRDPEFCSRSCPAALAFGSLPDCRQTG